MFRPYAYREEDRLYLYYEQYHAVDLFRESSILMRTADILHTNSGIALSWAEDSVEVLAPELVWERVGTRRVGNPFVFFSQEGEIFCKKIEMFMEQIYFLPNIFSSCHAYFPLKY